QPRAVRLDPSPLDEHEAARRGEDRPLLFGRERFPIEGEGDREVEDRVRTEGGGGASADRDLHLRPRRSSPRPAVRNPDDDPGGLERRQVFEEGPGLPRRPGERGGRAAALEQRPDERAPPGRALARDEEREEPLPIARR